MKVSRPVGCWGRVVRRAESWCEVFIVDVVGVPDVDVPVSGASRLGCVLLAALTVVAIRNVIESLTVFLADCRDFCRSRCRAFGWAGSSQAKKRASLSGMYFLHSWITLVTEERYAFSFVSLALGRPSPPMVSASLDSSVVRFVRSCVCNSRIVAIVSFTKLSCVWTAWLLTDGGEVRVM